MTTLREAAQQALEAMEYSGMDVGKFNRINAACQALRAALVEDAMQKFTDVNQELEAALAEPVQEPYWYVTPDGKYLSSNEVKEWMDPKTKALHLEPPQWRKEELIPLYTTPPQRKPLSEEELDELAMDKDGLPNSHIEFARAIERAHGIT